MSEQSIDALLAAFQQACVHVNFANDISQATKERAILRNELRAKLIEGEQWRTDFIAAEQTAQMIDKQWERLRVLVGTEHDDGVEWSHMVDRVEAMKAHLLVLAKLATGTPQFFNPVEAMNAKNLRDRILREAIREVAT